MLAELDDLTTAVAALRGELDLLDDPTLEAAVRRLATLQTTVQAVWLTALRVAEERALHRRSGARDTATWAATVAGERRGTTRRDVELASHLRDAPLVAEAMASGAVSKAKTIELVRTAELPEVAQARLIEEAIGAPVELVAASVQRARLDHGVEDVPVTPAMMVTRSRDRAKLEATVDLVDAELVEVAVHAAAEALNLPAETTTAERRARGLVAIARFFLDHADQPTSSRVGRPHVLVLVDLEVLEARAGGSALLASGAVITGDQARRLAMDANITRIITKGRSEPLDVGRSTRAVPPGIAKTVIARDRHCKYEGCTAPPWSCDIHHRVPWANFGVTALWNLGLLCWFHHEQVHRFGADRLTETDDGRWCIGRTEPARAAA
jgi:Domain of unknown function (DUF222)